MLTIDQYFQVECLTFFMYPIQLSLIVQLILLMKISSFFFMTYNTSCAAFSFNPRSYGNWALTGVSIYS